MQLSIVIFPIKIAIAWGIYHDNYTPQTHAFLATGYQADTGG